MKFEELHLSPILLESIKKVGFIEATKIQTLSIPKILENKNLIVESKTGSGKTASFVIPILEKLKATELNKKIKVLVLSPTRELAIQTTGTFFKFAQYIPHRLSFLSVIGGESIDGQNKTLSYGVEVVIATPGRLLDLVSQNTIDLSNIEILVLDEADKILDLGFAKELDNILEKIPNRRQNLFFSATFPEKVNELVKKISPEIEYIKMQDDEKEASLNVEQRVIAVNEDNRSSLLRHLISTHNWNQVLVFVNSKKAAANLASKLIKYNFNAIALHGDLSQNDRNQALSDFKKKVFNILIATDVAGRGIDIVKLPVVINFDLPRSTDDYIHRIGRTGRAGENGLAISFIDHKDFEHFNLIEKRVNIKLNRESISGFELTGELFQKITGNAPIKGKRKSKKDKLREQKNQLTE